MSQFFFGTSVGKMFKHKKKKSIEMILQLNIYYELSLT